MQDKYLSRFRSHFISIRSLCSQQLLNSSRYIFQFVMNNTVTIIKIFIVNRYFCKDKIWNSLIDLLVIDNLASPVCFFVAETTVNAFCESRIPGINAFAVPTNLHFMIRARFADDWSYASGHARPRPWAAVCERSRAR